MDFGWAIRRIKEGQVVCRGGWNGKGMWIKGQFPDGGSKMTLPYIYMKTVGDDLVPWLASQTDMLAEDWMIPVEAEEYRPERDPDCILTPEQQRRWTENPDGPDAA